MKSIKDTIRRQKELVKSTEKSWIALGASVAVLCKEEVKIASVAGKHSFAAKLLRDTIKEMRESFKAWGADLRIERKVLAKLEREKGGCQLCGKQKAPGKRFRLYEIKTGQGPIIACAKCKGDWISDGHARGAENWGRSQSGKRVKLEAGDWTGRTVGK